MVCEKKEIDGMAYAAVTKGVIAAPRDATDLVGECMGLDVRKALLPAGSLADDFFRLRTTLAGEVVQKFTNYRIIVAAVVDPKQVRGKFEDFLLETNRGSQFRIFETERDALDWLAQA